MTTLTIPEDVVEPAKKWIKKNKLKGWYDGWGAKRGVIYYLFTFDNEEEATWFALQWL